MKLKNVLLINSISSGLVGLLLTIFPDFFANLFQVHKVIPFVEVGAFLILFSLLVLITAFYHSVRARLTRLIIGLDITWVIASAIAVVLLFSSISTIGSVLILAVAFWVGLMAYLQTKALQRS